MPQASARDHTGFATQAQGLAVASAKPQQLSIGRAPAGVPLGTFGLRLAHIGTVKWQVGFPSAPQFGLLRTRSAMRVRSVCGRVHSSRAAPKQPRCPPHLQRLERVPVPVQNRCPRRRYFCDGVQDHLMQGGWCFRPIHSRSSVPIARRAETACPRRRRHRGVHRGDPCHSVLLQVPAGGRSARKPVPLRHTRAVQRRSGPARPVSCPCPCANQLLLSVNRSPVQSAVPGQRWLALHRHHPFRPNRAQYFQGHRWMRA